MNKNNILHFDLFEVTKFSNKYNKYFTFYNSIKEESFDFIETIPIHLLNTFSKDYEESIQVLENKDKLDYCKKLQKYETLFKSLTLAKIDRIAYKSFLEIEKNDTVISTIKTFKPNRGGFAKKTNYCNYSTSTGRLIVKKGPQILTLPSRCRSIIKSSFDKGKIISVDFSSLEPRLCLKLNGKDTENDVYEEIQNIISFNVDRSIIKRATISMLYGSSLKSLSGLSEERSKEVFNAIRNYFGYSNIAEIASYVDENDLRKNFFGRPIKNIGEEKKHILINNYIQSSAVDIAMQYFVNLVKKVDNEAAKPLFIIHDAIIFDIEENYLKTFNDIISSGFNHEKLGYFPLKLEEFNKN